MAERDHAVDVRIVGEALRREPRRDLVHDCGRTVDRRQHADVVARRDFAVGAHDAVKARASFSGQQIDGPVVRAVRIVAVELAELEVVAMHERAGRNLGRREADHVVVLAHGLALPDEPRRDLVAGRDLALAHKVFRRHRRADRNIGTRDHHVVGGMQPDHRPVDGLAGQLDHGLAALQG
jgi:hypothetical protein